MIRVALDAMGGDYGPSVVVPAAIDTIEKYSNVTLVLVGDQSQIEEQIKKYPKKFDASRFEIKHASEKVEMDESPAIAMRTKKDSSMRVAINLVKSKSVGACVSAGNTGALMAIARFVLKTLPGVDRPAIMYPIPVAAGKEKIHRMRMLDLGANVDCTAQHLLQFAVMGSVVTSAVDRIPNPRIGLLNIGSEAIKGSEVVKQTANLLTESNLNYIGYVEGTDMYQGLADVVVCDGFVGNVALKSSEGVAKMLVEYLKYSYNKNIFTKLAALISMPVLKAIRDRFEPTQYNGASLLGLNGIVIKSHGNAKKESYKKAIHEAIIETENSIPDKIRTEVEHNLKQQETA